ncbi:hypothetical protein B0H17DRAFT_1200526 [Mycena rosella]|uniref:Uncharacterized protein n=1 Tax=Mycena rosella TaxID=1033263 RepID=A0AAD7DJ58_MYCRO|nr:hypothetical protein B0H17DRAFT_1200526 [Mycena rosella]
MSEDHEHVQSKLDFATALSSLASGNYKASILVPQAGAREKLWGLDGQGQPIAPGDIAICGVLCALASLPCSAVKTQILENSTLGVYVEQEPYVRKLIEAYLNSNFKTMFKLLNRVQASGRRASAGDALKFVAVTLLVSLMLMLMLMLLLIATSASSLSGTEL